MEEVEIKEEKKEEKKELRRREVPPERRRVGGKDKRFGKVKENIRKRKKGEKPWR